MAEIVRFSVSLEDELLVAFDEFCQKRGYANRSEALRHCIRRELAADKLELPQQPAAGVLTLIYDHHENDLPRQLTAMQHNAHHAILSTLHIHLDHHNCMEIMSLRGPAAQIQQIANQLRSTKGVRQSSFSLLSLGESEC